MDNKTLNKEISKYRKQAQAARKELPSSVASFVAALNDFTADALELSLEHKKQRQLVWIYHPSGFNLWATCLRYAWRGSSICSDTVWTEWLCDRTLYQDVFYPSSSYHLAKGIFWSKHILLHRGLFHRCFCNSASSGTADGLCSITCTWWSLLSGGFFLDEDEESEVTNLWLWAQNFLKTAQSYPQYVDNYEDMQHKYLTNCRWRCPVPIFHYWPIQSNGSIQKIL